MIPEHLHAGATVDSAFERLDQTVTHLLRFIGDLPADQREPSSHEWAAWEVLAHLVAWHERMVAVLTALSRKRAPVYPEGTFADLNAAAIAALSGASIAVLCERLAAAQRQLSALLPAVADSHVRFKQGGAEQTLLQALTRMEQHIRGHLAGLQRQSRQHRSSLRHVCIDRAIYVVDDAHKTYWYEQRNPTWRDVSREECVRNQRALEGYTRVFRSGKTKVFHFDEAPSRAVRAPRERQERP